MTQLMSSLCGEPWCFTPAEVAKLTYYQIGRVLYAERDDKGQLVVRPKAPPQTAEERFVRAWLRRKLPRWRVREMWLELLRRAAEAEQARNAKDKPKQRGRR